MFTDSAVINSMFVCHFIVLPVTPGGTSGKEPTCQCRRHNRHRFDPCVRKIPWRRAQQLTPVCLLENPMDREACLAIVYRITKSWIQLKQLSKHALCDRFLGLLNLRVNAYLILLNIAKLTPIKIISLCILWVMGKPHFLYLTIKVGCQLLDFANLIVEKYYLGVILTSTSLINKHFLQSYEIGLASLPFAFLFLLCIFFLFWKSGTLHILEVLAFCDASYNTFSLSVNLSFENLWFSLSLSLSL